MGNPPRRRRITKALALSVACASLLALWSAPTAAGACASLRRVESYSGHATVTLAAGAAGADLGSTGAVNIGLGGVAGAIHLNLRGKDIGHLAGERVVSFGGPVSGGQVNLDYSYEDSGLDSAGDATFDGPLHKNPVEASLVLARKHCVYKIHITWLVHPTFQGDEGLDPGSFVGEAAYTDTHPIPDSLVLHGNDKFDATPDCDNPFEMNKGCATPAISAWMPDVIALTECGTLDLSNCQLHDDNPEIGRASFSWHLKPKFAKGNHKQK